MAILIEKCTVSECYCESCL